MTNIIILLVFTLGLGSQSNSSCDRAADAAYNFSGTWQTDWGPLRLNRTGTNTVSGSYSYSDEYGTVHGTVTAETGRGLWEYEDYNKGKCANLLWGTWRENRNGVERSGVVRFWIFEGSPNKLGGDWTDESTNEYGSWNGYR